MSIYDWFINHWLIILQIIGLLIVLLIIYLNFFSQKTPTWLIELVSYLNFREEKKIDEWLIYSKYFKKYSVNWIAAYTGKREGKELFFGLFEKEGKVFFCSIVKAEVSPMILTNQIEDQYDWENKDNVVIEQKSYKLFAKEKYLLANIKNSGNFQLALGEILKGKNNVVEFTALNQVLVVSDHIFNDSKEGIEYFAKFIKLKNQL